jgi:hypothetical protein
MLFSNYIHIQIPLTCISSIAVCYIKYGLWCKKMAFGGGIGWGAQVKICYSYVQNVPPSVSIIQA